MAFFRVILMKSGDACPADYFREAFFGRSKSFLRQKARAQKARKLGLSGLLASFPYINFALLKSKNYVIIHVQTVAFHRRENPDSCMSLHKGVGESGHRFAEEWQSKLFMLTCTTCRNPQMTAADSVGLMKENQATGAAA